MSKHTPGPWQLNHLDKTQVCDSDSKSRGCSPIAFVAPIGPLDERRANARLIAAAPDLLDALLNMRGLFDTPIYRRKLADDELYIESIKQLRAAIAAATTKD